MDYAQCAQPCSTAQRALTSLQCQWCFTVRNKCNAVLLAGSFISAQNICVKNISLSILSTYCWQHTEAEQPLCI